MSGADGRAELAGWLGERGVALSETQWGQLDAFVAELRAAAARTNLTADLDEASWWRRHLADGLAALPAMRARLGAAPDVLDLGAGAGFVGVALKVAWPEARVSLLEASYRKFQFLNVAAARLGLPGLRVLWRRAAGEFDAVLERAVAPLPQAAALTLPLVRPGGVFVAWQSEPPVVAGALAKALAPYGAKLAETVPYRLPGESRTRVLAFFERPEAT